MEQVSMIGIDLAKNSFQLHGSGTDGSVAFRKKLSRGKVLEFLDSHPRCAVAMEACASAHYWCWFPDYLTEGFADYFARRSA